MIDLHSHVLHGIDDGPRSLDGSLEIARAAAGEGITHLAATPHVRDDYPTEPATMLRALEEVRTAVAGAGIPIELLPGGEIALDVVRRLPPGELRAFALGGNPGYLLVEMPYSGWPLDLPDLLFGLLATGITPVLAHPERNDVVAEAPERLEPLVAAGSLAQLTAASVDGRLGRGPSVTAARLLDLGLAHLLASDAHAPSVRAAGMAAAARAIGDEQLAHWLTVGVPGAIVSGSPLPARPAAPRRRRWRR